MAALRSVWLVFFFSVAIFFSLWGSVQGDPDYKDALSKSILFFQGQRSGRLPSTQKITWRSHSGLSDGSEDKVDLVGGYYDSGDNVKFNFPMAFTTTMLSWGTLEYGGNMSDDQLGNAREAISWSANYLLKCATATAGKLYVGVGDPNEDHKCWERPEDMSTPRTVYSVSPTNPGSDVAGETAAALAAASMVFQSVNSTYAGVLLQTAKKVMQFAMQYRGAYSDKLGSAVCPFYCSYSGYQDELLWGAAWLFRATKDDSYFGFIKSLGVGGGGDAVFSWDNKFAGAYVLLSGNKLVGNEEAFEPFKEKAEEFMCSVLPNSPSLSQHYTPGGLMYQSWESNVFGYATAITFLLTTYAKYMATSNHSFSCGDLHVTSTTLTSLAKKQVDYILGENPLKMSYMVGFGKNYPQRIHHRGSSIPSVFVHKSSIGCQEGLNEFFHNSNPNPNILTGAIVGGPDQNDGYSDDRTAYSHSEPSTYINAAILGPLTNFAAMSSTT